MTRPGSASRRLRKWAIKDHVHLIIDLMRLTLHAMPALIRQPLKATHLRTKPVAAYSELTQYTAQMQKPKNSEVGLERIALTSNHIICAQLPRCICSLQRRLMYGDASEATIAASSTGSSNETKPPVLCWQKNRHICLLQM